MRKTCLGLALMAAMATIGCDDDDVKSTGDGGAKLDGGGGAAGGGSAGAAGSTTDGGTDAGNTNVTMAMVTLAATSAAPATNADGGSGSALGGSVVFTQVGANARAIINVSNAPSGVHGIHIHMGGSCADTAGDAGVVAAGAAGAHWNPAAKKHGELGADGGVHHAGDLGNVTVTNGSGGKTVLTTEWKVSDVVGKTVVLHMNADDLVTDPTGNSGARIACGVIAAR